MKRRPPQLDPPISRRRALHTHEIELWRSVMEIAPFARPQESPAAPKAIAEAPAKKPVKKNPEPQPQRLDKVSRAKISKGKKAIEATLDLHGFTVEVAYGMLVRFIAKLQRDTSRIVLVITGKGRAPQSGILRAQLPHWLELPPLREQVSGFGPAGAAHGGEGAWYITIRKKPEVKR